MIRSIFNDVIGPVMRGPSSSHTAASLRIGHLARKLLGEEPVHAVFSFDPKGSLVTTYRGQGSAMGLAAGLIGMKITDPELINAEKIASSKGLKIEYLVEDYHAEHPNTYKAVIKGKSGKSINLTVLSTGGGIIRLIEFDGEKIQDDYDFVNFLMPVRIKKEVSLPFRDVKSACQWILEKKDLKLSAIAKEYECLVGEIDQNDVLGISSGIAKIMREAIENGLEGTEFKDRILPGQSHLIQKASQKNKLIDNEMLNRIIESISAIMETKSSMGVIVAAPTAGACGTLGGTIIPVADILGKNEEQLSEAILAAGITGILIDMKAGFAAEEGGCQYETGSASAMTAAALVNLAGGEAKTALSAASMALQNTLGLICDPVADRVEVPCLGKNISAGMNALASANMALAGFKDIIPFEEVIDAMKEVADTMDHKYRCTCKGGLSITPASCKIQRNLKSMEG